MRKSHPSIVALLASLALVLFPLSASATNYWSQSGNACVPDHTAIANNDHLVTGGTVKHNTSSIAQVHLNCGVENNTGESNPNTFYLTYRDNSGSATQNTIEVKALFYRQARSNGTLTLIQTVDSDSSAVTTDNQISIAFTHTLDFVTYYYYVEGIFDRTSTSLDDVIFRGVALDYVVGE